MGKFSCPLCAKQLSNGKSLKQHVQECKRAAKKEEFVCELCGFKTLRKETLKNHERNHSGCEVRRTFKCTECPQKLDSSKLWREHVETVHKGNMPFICEICGAGFLRKFRMRDHKSAVHDNIALFKCGVCNEKFKNRSAIVKHVGGHLETSFHRCNECLMSFKCEATGYIHIRKAH